MGVGNAEEIEIEVNGREHGIRVLPTYYNIMRGRQGDRVHKTAQEAVRDSLKDTGR